MNSINIVELTIRVTINYDIFCIFPCYFHILNLHSRSFTDLKFDYEIFMKSWKMLTLIFSSIKYCHLIFSKLELAWTRGRCRIRNKMSSRIYDQTIKQLARPGFFAGEFENYGKYNIYVGYGTICRLKCSFII